MLLQINGKNAISGSFRCYRIWNGSKRCLSLFFQSDEKIYVQILQCLEGILPRIPRRVQKNGEQEGQPQESEQHSSEILHVQQFPLNRQWEHTKEAIWIVSQKNSWSNDVRVA